MIHTNNPLYKKFKRLSVLDITYVNLKIDAVKRQQYEKAVYWRELERENSKKLKEITKEINVI